LGAGRLVRRVADSGEKPAISLKLSAKNAARPWGFTLIELLTVVAIIAVLATLLSSALSSAKRKSRQSVSVGNLRQIALAFNMYRDDQQKRPPTYAAMVQGKYLAQKSLLCAEDRTLNWAGSIEESTFRPSVPTTADGLDNAQPPVDVARSYFKSFDLPEDLWNPIEQNPVGGIAACQLHGIGRQDPNSPPSLQAYQGLVLRALKDTAVVTRQVFWTSVSRNNQPTGPAFSAPVTPVVQSVPEMPLFSDDAP
jgi:prepilin-type N-terminal cleavage/methylation domain-containing protein